MKNVEMSMDGDVLIIKIDLTEEHGFTSSGRNVLIASTGGNVSVLGREENIGLTVFRRPLED